MRRLESFEGFQDKPESAFYCAEASTPEETWSRITDALSRVLGDALTGADGFELSPEGLARAHHKIFGDTFPEEAGRLRGKDKRGEWELVEFGIDVGTTKSRTTKGQRGTHPKQIGRRLREVFEQYHGSVASLLREPRVEAAESVFLIVRLYARLLRIHPFLDGNLRAAYVLQQVAAVDLGLIPFEFHDLRAHDDALGYALRVDKRQSYEPLTQLILRIYQEAGLFGR